MHSHLTLAVLSVPAMLLAGLVSSAHCAVMCGLLQARASRSGTVARHAGRLTAYALLGATAGGAGHWILLGAGWLPLGEVLRLGAILPLFLLMLRRQPRAGSSCCTVTSARVPARGPLRDVFAGMLMGLVPCPLLYAGAAYAALSGSAGRGALLLLAFGLGTLPGVQLGAWTWARLGRDARIAHARPALHRAIPLLVVGALVIVGLSATRIGAWCVS